MTDPDPLTIAREVVHEYGHLDRDTLFPSERQRLDLARTVIAVEDLADLWVGTVSTDDYEAAMRNVVKDLRHVLNGETDD